jgi:hypothetical protein
MELVSILRVLIRKRVMVGLACLASVAIALATLYAPASLPLPLVSSTAPTAHASSRVLVDMPASLLVNEPGGRADTAATRALLLADLAQTAPVKETIAQRAGIAPEQLHIVTPSVSAAPLPNALTEATIAVARASGARYVLELAADGQLPIVWVDATAPDREQARRLADAAAIGLQVKAGSGEDRLVVRQLAPPFVELLPGGSGRLFAIAAALGTFCLLCGGIVLGAGLTGRRRPAI